MDDTKVNFKIRTKKYKGLEADVHYSEEKGCYFGKVIGIRDTIAFTTPNEENIETEFKETVDDYFNTI
jgi:predicted HicB family RNase H-like nuclease